MKYNDNKINLLDLSKGLITVIASHFFPREHNHSLMSQVARLEGCQFPWSLLCTSEKNLLCDFNCLARGAKIVALILHHRRLTCHCWEVFFHPALSFKSYNPNRQNQRERKKKTNGKVSVSFTIELVALAAAREWKELLNVESKSQSSDGFDILDSSLLFMCCNCIWIGF